MQPPESANTWKARDEGLIYACDQVGRAHPSHYAVSHADCDQHNRAPLPRHNSPDQHNREAPHMHMRNGQTTLIRLAHGVYFPYHQWHRLRPSDQFRLRVKAQIPPGSRAIATGEAAAALHKLPLLTRNARISLANSGRRRGTPRKNSAAARRIAYTWTPNSLVKHVASSISEEHLLAVDGRRVTNLPKTVVDVCRSENSENGLLLADAALRRSVRTTDLLEVLREYPRSPGNRRARAIIARASNRSESIGESLTKKIVILSGIADVGDPDRPLLQQVEFYDDEGLVGRVDIFLPHLSLVIEFDGETKYSGAGIYVTEDTLISEGFREKRLKNMHLHVLRLSWGDVLKEDASRKIRQYAASLQNHLSAGGARFSEDYGRWRLATHY